MKGTYSPEDIARVRECLNRINSPHASSHWVAEVIKEARQMGLIPPERPIVGQCCRTGIDRGITYGGDFADVF